MRGRGLILGAILTVTAGVAHAGWVVGLDNGKQLSVDTYWEQNGQLHLQQGGVDVTLPRSRVTSMRQTPNAPAPVDERKLAPVTSTVTDDDPAGQAITDEALLARDEKVSHRMLRRQLAAFTARANGEDEAAVARAEARFKKAQQKFVDLQRELGRLPPAPSTPVAEPPAESGVRTVAAEPAA